MKIITIYFTVLTFKTTLIFSYTTYPIDTAGITFKKLGSNPLYRPLTPSVIVIVYIVSIIPLVSLP